MTNDEIIFNSPWRNRLEQKQDQKNEETTVEAEEVTVAETETTVDRTPSEE